MLGCEIVEKSKIAFRARAPGRRNPQSSSSPGKPDTWQRGVGDPMAGTWRDAKCKLPRRSSPSTENVADTESLLKASIDNSSTRNYTSGPITVSPRTELWPQLFLGVNCIALWISSEKILTRLYSVLHWFHKRLEVNVKNPRENLCFQTVIVFSFGSVDNSEKCTVLLKIAARLITVSTSVNQEMWVKLRCDGGTQDRGVLRVPLRCARFGIQAIENRAMLRLRSVRELT
jgi:hypothetical protein